VRETSSRHIHHDEDRPETPPSSKEATEHEEMTYSLLLPTPIK
jgi:hypothetical protein